MGGWRTSQIKQISFDAINARQTAFEQINRYRRNRNAKKEEISYIMKHKKNYKKIIFLF